MAERYTIQIEVTDNGTLRVFERGGRTLGEFAAKAEQAGRSAETIGQAARTASEFISGLAHGSETASEFVEGLTQGIKEGVDAAIRQAQAIAASTAKIRDSNEELRLAIALQKEVNAGIRSALDAEVELARSRAQGNTALGDAIEENVRLKHELSGLEEEQRAAAKAAKDLENAHDSASRSAGGLESAFSSLGAAIITVNQAFELAGKIFRGVGSAVETFFAGIGRAADLEILSQRIGVSVELLSDFKLAAGAVNLSTEDLGNGFKFLTQKLAEATSGTGNAAAAFEALFGATFDASAALQDIPGTLLELADKFSTMQDGGAKAALAMRVLGEEAGLRMVPLLNLGREGIQELIDTTHALGVGFTSETTQAAQAFETSMGILRAAISGVQDQLAAGMAPALATVASALVEFVANLGIGEGGVRSFGEALGSAIVQAVDSALGALNVFVETIYSLGIGQALLQVFGAAFEQLGELAVAYGKLVAANFLEAFGTTIDAGLQTVPGIGLLVHIFEPFETLTGAVHQRAREAVDGIMSEMARLGQGSPQLAALSKAIEAARAEIAKFDPNIELNDARVRAWQASLRGAGQQITFTSGQIGNAAKEAEDLTKALDDQISTLLTNIDAAQEHNDILEQIIEQNLSAEDAQVLLNDALEQGAIAQALAKDADLERAESIGLLVRGLAEEQQRQAQLNATRQAQQQTNQLRQEAAILHQVIAGTKELSQAEHEIAVLRERSKGIPLEYAEALVTAQDEAKDLREALKDVGDTGIEVGKLIGDAFSQTLDGLIAGTLDFGKIWESFTVSLGKQLFDNLWNEKLNFDEGFKFNLLDLVDWAGQLFSGGSIDIGGLFSLGGGGGGSGLLGLLGGGGGGGLGALGILGLLGGGFLAGGGGGLFGGTGGLALSALSLVNSGSALLGVGGGTGLIGALLGANQAGNLGTLLGSEIGGKAAGLIDFFFGPGSGASFLTSTSLSSIFGAAGVAGGALGAGFGTFNLAQGSVDAGSILGTIGGLMGAFAAGGPIGLAIGAIVAAIGALVGALADFTPTEGTLRRRAGESALTGLPTFARLEEDLGDITRSRYRLEDNPELMRQRERLGAEALTDITGFATLFAQAAFGEEDGGEHVAAIAQEWTNILTDFFSRMEGDSEEVSLAIRQNLLSAFKDMGVENATEAFEILNQAAESFKKNTADFSYFGEGDIEPALALGTAIRGVASIFESELPAGVHIAALALETMSKDGQTFFGDLDREGHETLLNLSKDAENFDKIVAHLFEEGFEIDTELFEQRLAAITDSVTFLGEHIGQVFSFEDVGVGLQAVFQQLRTEVLNTFQQTAIKQLFENTNFGAVFEPVFAALNRIDEFDLTTATGAQGFMELIVPALAQGKANLDEYIPILKELAKNWREIEKIIDEAFEPDKFERAAQIVEAGFGAVGGVLNEAITAGLAVLEDGGTYEQATAVFSQVFGSGVEKAFKDAVFAAIVDAAVIQPLVDIYQPAFQYVVAAGLIHGFDDPKVKEAFRILMGDLRSDAEELGLAVFDAKINSEELTSDIERAFNDAADIVVDWAADIRGALSGAMDAAFDVLREGGTRDEAIAAWNEALGEGTEKSVLEAIVRALIQAEAIEPFIKSQAPAMQYILAAALIHGIDDPRVQDALDKQFGPNSQFQHDLANLGPFVIDFYIRVVGPDGAEVGKTPVEGAATGGTFGSGSMAVVGEAGMPELVIDRGAGGFDVVPLSWTEARALMDGGMPGYADGTKPRLHPERERRNDYYPHGMRRGLGPGSGWGGSPVIGEDDARNPRNRDRGDANEEAERLSDLISFSFESAIEDFLAGGSLDDLHSGLREAAGKGLIEGLIQGMLEGILSEERMKELSDTVREAMEGGLDPEEIENITEMAREIADEVEQATKDLSPAIAAIAKEFGIELTDESTAALTKAMETAGQIIGGTLKSAFRDPANLNFDTFSQALKRELYGTIVDSLVDAFIDAAVVQGALAPLLTILTEEFGNLGKAIAAGSAEGIAAATAAIIETIGEITGIIDDPAFKDAVDLVIKTGRDIADSLGLTLKETTDNLNLTTDAFNEVADAAANACSGECELKRELLETDQGVTALNEFGRLGGVRDQTVVFVAPDRAPRPPDEEFDFERTLGGPLGPHGTWDWGPDEDWLRRERRRERRRQRREARRGSDDEWFYDPDIPPWREPERMAEGGLVLGPTHALLGEAGRPELVLPLDQLPFRVVEAGPVEAQPVRSGGDRETARELRALKESFDRLAQAHERLARALESQPVQVDVKIEEDTLVSAQLAMNRIARKAGLDLGM